jgi:hypothetical protein
MSQLIVEINRMREIMGIDISIKPMILEQGPGILSKIFGVADNALKDIEDNKTLIKQLDNLKPKGVKKLTQLEIDELAELLSKQADEIASAQASTGFEAATRYASANKLNNLINQTARTEADSLLNLYVNKQLTKIFEDTNNYWNKLYFNALRGVTNDVNDFVKLGEKIPEDELIVLFKNDLESKLKNIDPKFKWSDYPEYENWVMKKFLDSEGDLTKITERYQSNITFSKNRHSTFKQTDDIKTITKLDDIQSTKLSNFRAVNGIVKKLRNIIKKTPIIESFEKNVALLKGFPTEQIFKKVGQRSIMDEKFAALVRNIGFDIEQISTLEKNVLQNWRNLMTEVEAIDPKLVEGMSEVPIFKEVGNGWIWQEEKLNVFLERLSKRFEVPYKEGGGFWGLIIEEFKEIVGIVTLGKNSIITSTKNIYAGTKGFLKGVANAKFFSAGIWGAPFSPKQIGLMLTRRGYAPIPMLRSFLETWFTLHLWHNVIYSVVVLVESIGTWGLEKMGFPVTDDNRSLGEMILDGMYSLWGDYTSYLKFPFKSGFLIDFGLWVSKIFDDPVDQTSRELENDRDKYFDELWSNLSEPRQEQVLKGLEVGGTDFDTFSKVTDKNGRVAWYYNFKRINNITDDQITKIRESRVATVSKENRLGIPTEELKKIVGSEFDIEKFLKVGGIKDKDGNVYTIEKVNNNMFTYKFIPPPIYTFYGVQPSTDNKTFYVYMDKSGNDVTGKEIKSTYLTAKNLKDFGFNVGFDEKGAFTSKDEAEKVKESLKETNSFEGRPPITISELITKL